MTPRTSLKSRRRAVRAARTHLRASLGWLRGFPVREGWCLVPQLGSERGARARLRREPLDAAAQRARLRASSYALRSLQRRFPRALSEVTGDVGRWSRGVERRLRTLRSQAAGDACAAELLVDHPVRLQRAWRRCLSDSALAPLSEALVWTLYDEEQALQRTPARLARWAAPLTELLRRAPESGLEFALRACSAEDPDLWQPLVELLGDPLTWETPLRCADELRAFASALTRAGCRAQGEAPPPEFTPPEARAPGELLELTLGACELRAAERRDGALRLIAGWGLGLPRQRWTSWWGELEPVIRRGRQLAGWRVRSTADRIELDELTTQLKSMAQASEDGVPALRPQALRELVRDCDSSELFRLSQLLRALPAGRAAQRGLGCLLRSERPAGRSLVLTVLEALVSQPPEAWKQLEHYHSLLYLDEELDGLSLPARRAVEACARESIGRWQVLPDGDVLVALARRTVEPERILAFLEVVRRVDPEDALGLVALSEEPADVERLAPALELVDWNDRWALRTLAERLLPEDRGARQVLRDLALDQPAELWRLARRVRAATPALRAELLAELRAAPSPRPVCERLNDRWEAHLLDLPGRELFAQHGLLEVFSALREDCVRAGEHLIRARLGPAPWDLRHLPANAEFLERLVRRGFDPLPWCEGIAARVLPTPQGPLSCELEVDPLEVLRLAFTLGGESLHSREDLNMAVGVALDVNKRLLCVRSAEGVVLARCVLGLSDYGTLTPLRPDLFDSRLRPAVVERAVRDFVRDLAGAIGGHGTDHAYVQALLGPWSADFGDWEETPLFRNDPNLAESLRQRAYGEDAAAWALRLRRHAPHGVLPFQLASYLIHQGQGLGQLQLRELAQVVPGEAWLLLRLAGRLRVAGDWDLALELLERVPRATCSDGCCDVRYEVAEELLLHGRPSLALRALRRVGPLSSRTSAAGVLLWAKALVLQGRRRRALRVLRDAHRRSPPMIELERELERELSAAD